MEQQDQSIGNQVAKEVVRQPSSVQSTPNGYSILQPVILADGESPPIQHPLDPLNGDEINLITRLLKEHPQFESHMRTIMITPNEIQDKNYVLNYKPDDPLLRSAMVLIRDPKARANFRVIINLTNKTIDEFVEFKNGQPNLTFQEIIEADESLRSNEQLIEAFAKRNIDMKDVVFYPFSSGYRDERDDASKRRIMRPYAAVRKWEEDNYYAHHIDGIVITVDLDSFAIEVEDHMIVPIPPKSGNFDPEGIKSSDNVPYFPDGVRNDLKPFVVTQPEGPSFQINGYEITWQKWRFRVGFNARESLTINLVEYFDQNRWRPILYRAGLSEMWVPYGDTNPTHSYKNAYDVGEVGLGLVANSLVLGCDCLGEIRYLDAVIHDSQGRAILLKHAVCIHEEDIGILWKHTEFVEQRVQCRRARRLVVSSIITVGNYEYGLFWYFLQDGALQFEAKLTGIIAPGGIEKGKLPVSGGLVAEGVYGPHHQHFFNVRLDWMLDGPKNSLVEINCETMPHGPDNPAGNGWIPKETIIETVGEARRLHDARKGRLWKIVNTDVKNHVDQPVAYKLALSGAPCFPLCHEDSTQGKRGAFARYHLWGTKYRPDELFAAGLFSNQGTGVDDGIPIYSEKHKDESLVQCDLVTWYTFGISHIVRSEDWPVMPVETTGFRLLPFGFFAGSAAMDVPPSVPKCHGSTCSYK